MRFLAATIAGATLTILAAVPLSAATFTPIGDLPGGTFFSQTRGVSNDGAVVVGFSSGASGTEAFRWTQSTGMVGLSDFPEGANNSQARGVSADGAVVVGIGNKTGFVNDAFRWTAEEGLVGLGDLPGGSVGSEAWGVSADGNVVVGQSVMGTPILGPNIHAFRWTTASNSLTDLGTLFPNNGGASIANAVSGDGTAVVGYSSSPSGNQAFRWTEGAGMVGLGDLEGGDFYSEAFAVSFDGSVVVGRSSSGSGETLAFRWTQVTGMVSLGDLQGGQVSSAAKGVSADGSIVVGFGNSSNFARATIWDAANGMRNLQDLLTSEYGLGASLTGWTLHEASAISADGDYIVGYGTNPSGAVEGWLLSLAPTTTNLPGDFNDDGEVDAADYTIWRDYLGSEHDLSGNGDEQGSSAAIVDQADYELWKSNYGNSGGGSLATQVPEPSNLLLTAMLVSTLLTTRRHLSERRKADS